MSSRATVKETLTMNANRPLIRRIPWVVILGMTLIAFVARLIGPFSFVTAFVIECVTVAVAWLALRYNRVRLVMRVACGTALMFIALVAAGRTLQLTYEYRQQHHTLQKHAALEKYDQILHDKGVMGFLQK